MLQKPAAFATELWQCGVKVFIVRCQWWSMTLWSLLIYGTTWAVTFSFSDIIDSDFRLFFIALCSQLLILICCSDKKAEIKPEEKYQIIILIAWRWITCSFSLLFNSSFTTFILTFFSFPYFLFGIGLSVCIIFLLLYCSAQFLGLEKRDQSCFQHSSDRQRKFLLDRLVHIEPHLWFLYSMGFSECLLLNVLLISGLNKNLESLIYFLYVLFWILFPVWGSWWPSSCYWIYPIINIVEVVLRVRATSKLESILVIVVLFLESEWEGKKNKASHNWCQLLFKIFCLGNTSCMVLCSCTAHP